MVDLRGILKDSLHCIGFAENELYSYCRRFHEGIPHDSTSIRVKHECIAAPVVVLIDYAQCNATEQFDGETGQKILPGNGVCDMRANKVGDSVEQQQEDGGNKEIPQFHRLGLTQKVRMEIGLTQTFLQFDPIVPTQCLQSSNVH